jgi:hypothetical protein
VQKIKKKNKEKNKRGAPKKEEERKKERKKKEESGKIFRSAWTFFSPCAKLYCCLLELGPGRVWAGDID